jgi:hypothetical protein
VNHDKGIYVLTFLNDHSDPYTMTSYGLKNAVQDIGVSTGSGHEFVSMVRVRVLP